VAREAARRSLRAASIASSRTLRASGRIVVGDAALLVSVAVGRSASCVGAVCGAGAGAGWAVGAGTSCAIVGVAMSAAAGISPAATLRINNDFMVLAPSMTGP
jgi:hypothetical protein